MSETKQGGNSNRSQNKNRQGGNRNNRNNNGGNRNRNNNGGNRNNTRNRQGGNRNNQGRNKKPAPKPLTFWQKILAKFGIKPQTQAQARPPRKSNDAAKKNTNTAKPAAKKQRQPEKVEVTSGRLYVGNLSYETTEYDIEELFKGNGPVKSVEIIYNRHTHKSKGYGFVEMLKAADAKNAVDVHHDQPFMGRNLIVNGAKTRQPDNNKERSTDSESTNSDAA